MDESSSFDSSAQKIGYFLFMDRDEKTDLYVKGILDETIDGYLVLTDKKVFFFFWSNINRDKKFIATHPYLVSAEIKKGTFYSTITLSSRKETFTISRVKKSDADLMMEKLESIITGNK